MGGSGGGGDGQRGFGGGGGGYGGGGGGGGYSGGGGGGYGDAPPGYPGGGQQVHNIQTQYTCCAMFCETNLYKCILHSVPLCTAPLFNVVRITYMNALRTLAHETRA